MKILILEDSTARIETFKKKLKGHDVYYFDNVKQATQAIELLGPFDYYFIDHDLDDKVYVDSEEENTGYQLAKYMVENNVSYEQVIVHSMNSVGAENIKNVLEDAVVVPFPNLF